MAGPASVAEEVGGEVAEAAVWVAGAKAPSVPEAKKVSAQSPLRIPRATQAPLLSLLPSSEREGSV